LAADNTQTLVCLAEFIRGKGQAINEEYAATFTSTTQRKHSAHLIEHSRNRLGNLKLFTKLVLLYEHDSESIRRIFVRKLWRGRNTTWEFLSPVIHDETFVRKLCRSTNSLADALSDAFDGYDLRFFTTVRMDGWQVVLLQREYAPIVRPDFRDVQKTIHGFGWIMFAVELGKVRILMKGGGKKSLPIVRTWFDNQLQIELSDAEFDIVTTYDPQQVEAAFFGETTQDCPVQIAAISFHRTMAPGHSAMSMEPLFPGQDIQRDLQFAKEKGLLRIRSLSDIKSFRLRHKGKESLVQVAVDLGGAVTLRLDNTDMSEEAADSLCEAFKSHFSIPLNRRIDPQKLILGSVDVYNYLLETDRTEGLAQYQVRALRTLIQRGVLNLETEEIVTCPKQPFICKLGGKPVVDEDISECPECQTALQVKSVEFIRHNDTEIRKITSAMLTAATGWTFDHTAVHFEGGQFYPLRDPDRPDRVIRVYFAKRVGERVLRSLDRSLQPVLVAHTGGDVEHAHLDAAGVAHISFARALAAETDVQIAQRFNLDARHARDDLMRRQEEKVYRRAAASRQRLEAPPADYTGEMYQLDIFSILRSVFPYTEYWTGANRPDGFCCLVYFESANLRSPVKHNWSYDAKLNKDGTGYDLGVGEKRKEWDYVAALAKQPELSAQGNELNGHVLISNRFVESQMRGVAQFLRREHRLGKKHPNVKIVFMVDSFVASLYDSVRANEHDYRKRWNWLGQRFASVLASENEEGYVRLDGADAGRLCEWVLKQPEVETPPSMMNLSEGMHETMSKS